MQIKQTNAAIYASLILILTFELSFSQSILANLAVFMGCIIFLIGQRKSRLLLWLFSCHFYQQSGRFGLFICMVRVVNKPGFCLVERMPLPV